MNVAKGPRPNRVLPKLLFGVALLLVLWSAHQSRVDPGLLFDGERAQAALSLLDGFTHPDLSPEMLNRIGTLALESLMIGFAGLGLALLLALPFAYLAARIPGLPDPPAHFRWRLRGQSATRALARLFLLVARGVPEIVWAFLFVGIVGLGPGPAVVAIGLTFGGIIGKLFAEMAEAVPPGPVLALQAQGASRFSVFLYGVLPQVKSQWVGYGLFRLECGIRSASILGVVGAGGIGMEIDLAIRYFEYDKLATALIAVLLYMVILEILSYVLRRSNVLWPILFIGLGAIAGGMFLDVPWGEFVSDYALFEAQSFLAAFATPTLDGGFVLEALSLMAETLGMALFGSLLAALGAFVLAPFAARIFTGSGSLADGPKGPWFRRSSAVALLGVTRGFFQLTRALPELVWALIFVAWVGGGPFAGTMAIAVHTFGILGRLFAEIYEEVDSESAQALERLGAKPTGRWAYAVLPVAFPRLLAFTLFRFEVNVRATAMMGFVGAGGIGDAIHSSIETFQTNDLATLLLVLLGTVAIVDTLGDRLRQPLMRA